MNVGGIKIEQFCDSFHVHQFLKDHYSEGQALRYYNSLHAIKLSS